MEIFVSTLYGLNLPYSDIDFGLYLQKNENEDNDRNKEINILRNICLKLGQLNNIKCRIIYAKVPIIKSKYYNNKNKFIEFDINFGHKDGILISNYIKNIFLEKPYLKQIYFPLKILLMQKKLNETKNGGMNSISLISMIYAFDLYLNQQNKKNQFLFNFLISFFEFYGNFNYFEYGICVEGKELFYKKKMLTIIYQLY